jgi:predicted acylesterase/phospholipase RssA/outer membrane translocation and assembly module TamA
MVDHADSAGDSVDIVDPAMVSVPRVALALSGGGARGLAQIGVLRAFEESGIAIDLICGVSMGAIVGGLYAAGMTPDSLEALVRSIDWGQLLQNAPPRARLLLSQKEKDATWFLALPLRGIRPQWPTGAISGQGLYNFLSHLTQGASYRSGADFDNLRIRYRAVATDLGTGKRVVFSGGELAFALRAAMAFPLAVTPLREGEQLYADGGLVDPLPVELTQSLSDCPVVAINTTTGLAPLEDLVDPYAVANQAITVMTSARLEESLQQADIICQPAIEGIANVGFGDLDTLLALGYAAGVKTAKAILASGLCRVPSVTTVPAEDQRPPLTTLLFKGTTVFADSTLRLATGLMPGDRCDAPTLANARDRILALYAAEGYTLADVTSTEHDSGGVLRMTIDEAPLVRIELTGNKSVKNWVILRNFPLHRGLPYNAERAAEGMSDLHATGLFDQVTSEITRTDAGPILHLKVTEKTTDALRVGLHHNLEYQTESFLEWATINLFGIGNELTAHAQYAPRRETYSLRLKSDRIFRTYLSAALRGYYRRHTRRLYQDHERVGSFETVRLGFEASFAQNISRFAQVALHIGAEDVDFTQGETVFTKRLARFAVVGRLDDLDHANFPTRGHRLEAKLYWADDFLAGEIIYRAFHAHGQYVVSPNRRWTLDGAFQFATSDRPLPVYEQIGLGGRRSFFGLADDELLHDHLLSSSLGVRYRFYPWSYLVLRTDVGNAWPHGEEIDFWGELRAGIGGGAMFDTPLGPLAVLYGYADSGDSRFYFSWGYDF